MTASCNLFSFAAAVVLLFIVIAPMATLVGGVLEGPLCKEFTGSFVNHYCSHFNYRAVFPNLRGHTTLEEAAAEFNDFIPLLRNGCHEKLGTFLCFIYFPFCLPYDPHGRIYPCKEVCEVVTGPDSDCTAILMSIFVSWPEQLQCQQAFYKPASSRWCVDGIAPTYPGTFMSNLIGQSRHNTIFRALRMWPKGSRC